MEPETDRLNAHAAPLPRNRGAMVVQLVPGFQPHGKIQRKLQAALANGPLRLDRLLEEVSERLLRSEVRRGGGAADLGMYGSDLFRNEVASEIAALDGQMLRIDPLPDTVHGDGD